MVPRSRPRAQGSSASGSVALVNPTKGEGRNGGDPLGASWTPTGRRSVCLPWAVTLARNAAPVFAAPLDGSFAGPRRSADLSPRMGNTESAKGRPDAYRGSWSEIPPAGRLGVEPAGHSRSPVCIRSGSGKPAAQAHVRTVGRRTPLATGSVELPCRLPSEVDGRPDADSKTPGTRPRRLGR